MPFQPVCKSISIILPSMPTSAKWSLSFRIPYQNSVNIPLLHVCNVLCPSHPPWFVHHNNIQWVVQAVKLLIMQSSQASCYFLPLRSKHLPWHCSWALSSNTLPIIWENKFHIHTKQHINIFSYFWQVIGGENLWTELYQASPEFNTLLVLPTCNFYLLVSLWYIWILPYFHRMY